MLDRNALERTLLLGIVRDHNWEVLILNNINKEYFTYANHKLYDYIESYVTDSKYPELAVIGYEFQIDDESMRQYTEISDLNALCEALKKDYMKSKVQYEVSLLNEYSDLMETDPVQYVEKIGDIYNDLKLLGHHNKSVDLFKDIEQVAKIDPSDVISTGFKELDEKLVGWKRGEELVIVVGRTGQGKSWMGLKFAMSAAIKGERVGIYSGEMSTQQLQERILCCAKQNYTDSQEQALQFVKDHNLFIRVLTQKELRRRANVDDIEEMIIRDKLTMLVVDQLSLVEDKNYRPGNPIRFQYGNISDDLYSLSIKYDLPVILLVQSNRQGINAQNAPELENIAESDAVAQNATRVISMRNENGILTLKIIKNRYGSSDLVQKYEVDYGINKYKPIREVRSEISSIKKAKARQIFGGGGMTF